jgi:uncharacterized protein YjgD (DUF1641 family)
MTIAAPERDVAARLDELSERVDALTAMLEADRAGRRAMSELTAEAMPLARSAFEVAAERLDERSIEIDSVVSLLLRLGEAAPDLERALDGLDSLTELTAEIGGLSGEALALLIDRFAELERRGYFTWIKGGLEVIDRIITGFDEDDIEALGDNVVLIFETVKEMTQPEVMRMLQRSARMMREDVAPPEKLSMFRLLRELRDPEVKLAIYRTLTMLKGMSAVAGADPTEMNEHLPEHSAKEE